MKTAVCFSGGKDSTAMLLKLIEKGIAYDEIVFADTQMEYDALYDFIEYFKKQLLEKIPEMFKTKNVGNVWELPFNSFRSDFGKKETKSKWGHSGFPVNLPKACIILSSKEGDLVLDPFTGTGTTQVACKELNRRGIGIDHDSNACKIAEERINSAFTSSAQLHTKIKKEE